MITIPRYQPMTINGPYLRKLRIAEIVLSAIAHVAIAVIFAYSVLGMAGAWDEAQACIQCAGGVR